MVGGWSWLAIARTIKINPTVINRRASPVLEVSAAASRMSGALGIADISTLAFSLADCGVLLAGSGAVGLTSCFMSPA